MPLSINQYSTWATQNMGSEVALSKGAPGLDRASNQVGALARFFGTQSAQNVRKEVMADFTRALSSRYGVSLAHQALAEAGLTPTSKLDGKTIASVDAYARMHRDMAVDSLLRQDDIKLVTGSVTRAQIETYNRQATRNYLSLRRLAIDVLGEMPIDKASADDFRKRCDTLLRQLFPTANPRIPPTDPAAIKLHEAARALTQALADKKAQINAMLEGRPLSDANMKYFKAVWAAGATRALSMITEDCPLELQNVITTLRDAIRADDTSFNTFLDSMPLEELRDLLGQALENKEIYMVYQPVFDKDKNVTGLEAFIRWNSSAFGMINNYEFLAAAEKTGRIYEIGEYSIKTALDKLKEINKEFPDLTMTVNISSIQLRNSDIESSFSNIARESGCDLKNVIVDIPEESLLSNFPLIQPILEKLSYLGVTMALDNFGRGYSSLNNIPLLPISMVKLDGHFTSDLKSGSSSRALTDSIIALLNEIDVPVDATGVGNADQYKALVEFGCTYFQGKFLCDPMKGDEVISFLRKIEA